MRVVPDVAILTNSLGFTCRRRVASFRSWLRGVGRRGAGDGSGSSPRYGDSAVGMRGRREEKPGASASASGDAKLIKLGLESPLDRRRVMAIVTGEDEAPQFVNWFEVCHARIQDPRPPPRASQAFRYLDGPCSSNLASCKAGTDGLKSLACSENGKRRCYAAAGSTSVGEYAWLRSDPLTIRW